MPYIFCLYLGDELTLAYPTNSYEIMIKNVVNLKTIKCLSGHRNKIYCIKYYAFDKEYLISSSRDYTIRLWDLISYIAK